jgi:hypothetical protein
MCRHLGTKSQTRYNSRANYFKKWTALRIGISQISKKSFFTIMSISYESPIHLKFSLWFLECTRFLLPEFALRMLETIFLGCALDWQHADMNFEQNSLIRDLHDWVREDLETTGRRSNRNERGSLKITLSDTTDVGRMAWATTLKLLVSEQPFALH